MDIDNVAIQYFLILVVLIMRAIAFILEHSWYVLAAIAGAVLAMSIVTRRALARQKQELLTEYASEQALQEKNRENHRRAREQQEWLQHNTLTLFYHTMGGVTAVMIPEDYRQCVSQTADAYRNCYWNNPGVLMPSDRTFLFATIDALERYAVNKPMARPFSGGLLGSDVDLRAFVDGYQIKLVHARDIFVPYVNEAILRFSRHKQYEHRGEWKVPYLEIQYLLVQQQMPAEIRTIQ